MTLLARSAKEEIVHWYTRLVVKVVQSGFGKNPLYGLWKVGLPLDLVLPATIMVGWPIAIMG